MTDWLEQDKRLGHVHEWGGWYFSGYTDHYEGNTEDIYYRNCQTCSAHDTEYRLR